MMAEALSKLLAGEGMGMPGITTSVIPQDGIFLEENTSGRRTRIGVYAPPELERGHEVSCQPFAAEGDAGSLMREEPVRQPYLAAPMKTGSVCSLREKAVLG